MDNSLINVVFGGGGRLYVQLLQALAIIITAAFFLSQSFIARSLFNLEESVKKQVFLGIFFGCISILGTLLGIYTIDGAIANVRDIGAITGGLFGGPIVGAIAGVMGSVHRASLGGFSANACSLATLTNGILAGFVYKLRRGRNFHPFSGLLFAAGAECYHMGLVFLMSKPRSEAIALIREVSGPMILMNAIGVGLFLLVIESSMRERELVSAITAEKVLKITEKTLPVLSKGFTSENAEKAARIILKGTNLDAVGITDKDMILAFIGLGEDHHKSGGPLRTASSRRVLEKGEIAFLRNKREIACDFKGCPLGSGVVVPLKGTEGEVFGSLKLYRRKANAISPLDVEIAKGLAAILANQIELNKIEEEKRSKVLFQLKALQAYINPHFLFNTLNTISYVVRKNPEKGRYLIQKLSYILRETIYRESNFVEVKEELDLVKSYLEIEKERLGDRLDYEFNVDERLLEVKVPSLILQPIVENAIKHGYSSSVGKLKVSISVSSRINYLYLAVEDTGKGMSKEKLKSIESKEEDESIGLRNVLERLKNLYDVDYNFKIRSTPGKGTKVTIAIPLKGVKDWLLEQLSLTTKSLQEKR